MNNSTENKMEGLKKQAEGKAQDLEGKAQYKAGEVQEDAAGFADKAKAKTNEVVEDVKEKGHEFMDKFRSEDKRNQGSPDQPADCV